MKRLNIDRLFWAVNKMVLDRRAQMGCSFVVAHEMLARRPGQRGSARCGFVTLRRESRRDPADYLGPFRAQSGGPISPHVEGTRLVQFAGIINKYSLTN